MRFTLALTLAVGASASIGSIRGMNRRDTPAPAAIPPAAIPPVPSAPLAVPAAAIPPPTKPAVPVPAAVAPVVPPAGPAAPVEATEVEEVDEEEAPEPEWENEAPEPLVVSAPKGPAPVGGATVPQGPPPPAPAAIPWTTSGTPPGPGAIPPKDADLPDLSFASDIFEAGPEAASPKLAIQSPPGAYSVALIQDHDAFPHRTVYVPQNVPAGTLVPIVAWENDGAIKYGRAYQGFLTEIASHGYLVVAPGPLNHKAWGRTSPRFQRRSIHFAKNWKNATVQVDTKRIAIAGHGQGAAETLWNLVKTDTSEISTGILLNHPLVPYLFNEVEAPVLYVSGGETDFGHVAQHGFDFITKKRPELSAALVTLETGHLGSFGLPRGGIYAETVKNWLNYQLKNDTSAKAFFVGGAASAASTRGWKVQTNAIV